MKFKDYLQEEYIRSMRVLDVTMEFHKNPRKSDLELPVGWELKGWLDATTGDLYVMVPHIDKWTDASDFEHETLYHKTGIPNKNKVIPVYLNKNGVDIGEWSMTVALRYNRGWEKIYDKYSAKGGESAMRKIRNMAYEFAESNKNIARFFGTSSYKVGSF